MAAAVVVYLVKCLQNSCSRTWITDSLFIAEYTSTNFAKNGMFSQFPPRI